jgi:hypothetical protein
MEFVFYLIEGMGVIEDIVVITKTDKSHYSVGEEAKISITLSNKGAKSVELLFASAQRYDIVIKEGENRVWYWSSDKMFAMTIGTVVLKPGKKKTYKATWKIETEIPGEYDVIGTIKSQPSLSDKRTIKIIT